MPQPRQIVLRLLEEAGRATRCALDAQDARLEAPPMPTIRFDHEEFGNYQGDFLEALADTVRDAMLQTGLSQEDAWERSEELLFSIGSLLDGALGLERRGQPFRAHLCFELVGKDELLSSSGSWIHEIAHDAMGEAFDRLGDE